MIYGVGTDISEVKRFKKWIENPGLLNRFFNQSEIVEGYPERKALEYYSSRFSCKEAFAKALGTGFTSFSLSEISVVKDENGKPFMKLSGNAEKLFRERCGDSAVIHVSLSHEKEYSAAFVVIEN